MTPLKLYGAPFSYFVRAIRLVCQYKGLPHEVTQAPFGEEIPFFQEEHGKLHPFKKMPVLIDEDFVLPESLAIANYLESKGGPSIFPEDAIERAQMQAQVNYLSIYMVRAIMVGVILEFAFPKGEDASIRFDVVEENMAAFDTALQWLEQQVAGDFYWGHSFTLCDAYLVPMLDYAAQLPAPYQAIQKYPKLMHYIEFQRSQAYAEGVLGPK